MVRSTPGQLPPQHLSAERSLTTACTSRLNRLDTAPKTNIRRCRQMNGQISPNPTAGHRIRLNYPATQRCAGSCPQHQRTSRSNNAADEPRLLLLAIKSADITHHPGRDHKSGIGTSTERNRNDTVLGKIALRSCIPTAQIQTQRWGRPLRKTSDPSPVLPGWPPDRNTDRNG